MKAYGAILLALLVIFCSADTASYASIPPSILHPGPAKVHKPPGKPIIGNTTCYYRVLKGQKEYVESYQEDIDVNGTGITYSGKVVQVGHLAADLRPGMHRVGERYHVFIDDKDHGIWTIEDKGGDIKGYKRFDFCAGAGDKGRKLAQSWGRGKGHKVEMYRVGRNT